MINIVFKNNGCIDFLPGFYTVHVMWRFVVSTQFVLEIIFCPTL